MVSIVKKIFNEYQECSANNQNDLTSSPHFATFDENNLSLSFNLEKQHDGEGEDADPLIHILGNSGCIAVFDGLGGAGTQRVTGFIDGDDKNKKRKTAYIASRYAQFITESFIQENGITLNKQYFDEFESNLKHHFSDFANDIPKNTIISKGDKKLPTTMASIFYTVEQNILQLTSCSIGDSRAYLLTNTGLKVVSQDNSRAKIMQTLHAYERDVPMNSCIDENAKFTFEIDIVTEYIPTILLSCSDGCYGCFESAIHFEEFLLQSLDSSHTMQEWQEKIVKYIEGLKDDDASMSLLAIGFESFNELKQHYQNRFTTITACLKQTKFLQKKYQELEKITSEIQSQANDSLENVWNNYKKDYFQHLKGDTNEH